MPCLAPACPACPGCLDISKTGASEASGAVSKKVKSYTNIIRNL